MNQFSADDVGKAIFHNMMSDFRNLHGHNFAAGANLAFAGGVKEFRGYEWPRLGVTEVSRFKAWWQLRHLFKVHRFQDDVYTDEQLEQRTNDSYVNFQQSVSLLDINNPIVFRVVQEARKIAKRILGDFDPEAIISFARFGKRSSIGCGFQNAYIDYKLTTVPAFTSTVAARKWFFNDYLPNDPVLKRVVKRLFRTAKAKREAFNFVCVSLKLVNVPKSWKTLRTITPLSLLELFYTFAVGGVIQERLAENGLDITVLQAVHRKLAQLGSSGDIKIATTDLSRASDSILSQLLCAVLPRGWYNALRPAFCRQVTVDGITMATHTVLPMGNGFTFPVETLIFYCLTKAIGNLARVRGIFSVYGDDIIYPQRLHKYVCKVFPLLGLTINEEKSYADSFFRESCGGDYYRGCDVRPYIFKGEGQTMSRSRYLCLLYKAINGLRTRWAEEELPNTFRWLMSEITYVGKRVLQVPWSFPDYSGVRTKTPQAASWLVPWSSVKASGLYTQPPWAIGSGAYVFQHLKQEPGKRVVLCTEPYYWLAYRQLGSETEEDYGVNPPLEPADYIAWRQRVRKTIISLDHSLEKYLKGFVRSLSNMSISDNEEMLSYVRRKGTKDTDPCCTVRGRTIVTSCSSVVTYWA